MFRWLMAGVIFIVSCTGLTEKETSLLRLHRLKAERVPADSVYALLQTGNPLIAGKALEVLGELQDTTAVDTLYHYFQKQDPDLSTKAGFALGQTGYACASLKQRQQIEQYLLSVRAENSSLRSVQLIALGKTGDLLSVEAITRAMSDSSPAVAGSACMAAAIMAIRSVRPAEFRAVLGPSYSEHRSLRQKAAYAMMRIADTVFTLRLLAMTEDPDEQVRMFAARGLGALAKKITDKRRRSAMIDALLSAASNDTVWMVRVNAVNALGEFRLREEDLKKAYFLIAFEGKPDPSEHVRLAAIRAMASSYAGDIRHPRRFLEPFIDRFIPSAGWRERAAIMHSIHTMFGSVVLSYPEWRTVCEQQLRDSRRYARAQAVSALQPVAGHTVIEYLQEALKDSFMLVRQNALTVLGQIRTEQSRELVLQSMNRGDYTVLVTALQILSEDSIVLRDTLRAKNICQQAAAAYRSLKPCTDASACLEMMEAAQRFGLAESREFIRLFTDHPDPMVAHTAMNYLGIKTADKPKITTFSWNDEEMAVFWKRIHIALIRTEKGNLEMELYPASAPVTVVNFVRLAQQKFFDGLYIHRVVPNFVVQTGDPLGSGWGGPDYRIVSEFSPLPFERGTVGMASAGKDTEGSQWFICHSAQPHLEGRYTVFGKIRKGMEVVDQLQVGDRILSVEIIRF